MPRETRNDDSTVEIMPSPMAPPLPLNIVEMLEAANSRGRQMNHPETKRLAAMATGKHENLDLLWKMVRSGDRETSINALWAITHLIKSSKSDSAWLQSLQRMK